jgi:hypothetical protein
VPVAEAPTVQAALTALRRVLAPDLEPDPTTGQRRLSTKRGSLGADLVPAWTVDLIPPGAVLALNAGQFGGGAPWGWLVRDGVEVQPPGVGALGMAFVVDKAGAVSLVAPDELAGARREAAQAFQSYPALLTGEGLLPWELQAPGRGVDLFHRDSRLALGIMRDGSIVVALTRVDVIGRGGETIPWGPTVPEMAAFMKSLGCLRAMMLDGGLSSQLAVRGTSGLLSWKNWRPVPLGLIAFPVDR